MPENCPANGENAEQKTDNKKKKAKRKCKVCGTTLSEYNKNDRCFCHYELDMDNSEDWQKGGLSYSRRNSHYAKIQAHNQ